LHLDLFGDQQSLLYMAPEAIAGTPYDAAKLDVFALGAVAYHIFSGQAPATTIEELHQKCYQGRGLRISEVMDGAGRAMQELIQFGTAASVEDRLDSVHDFLDLLEGVENELTAPAPEAIVNPTDARVNDRLAGGFLVKKRLGKGSTSVALLVERDGRKGVLKVTLEPSLNARLIEEGQILRRLRHANIVELYEQTEINGHVALFMAVAGVDIKSGAYTLAQRLRLEGRLSLDLLQRFGEELLIVADWLEQHGISHRDIKPDNIGMGRAPSGRLPEERRILLAYLGMDDGSTRGTWLAQQELAERLGVSRETIQHVLRHARERWSKQPWMTILRQEIAALIEKSGGVMTIAELTTAVLGARGSVADEPQRSQWAAAVACAAVDTEMTREGARYTLHRGTYHIFVVAMPGLTEVYAASPAARARYAEELGRRADEIAAADPLLTPSRAVEELQSVTPPAGDPPMQANASCGWPRRHHRRPRSRAVWSFTPAVWRRGVR
jgi:Protein kinase domain